MLLMYYIIVLYYSIGYTIVLIYYSVHAFK